jgi:hypothetical protein
MLRRLSEISRFQVQGSDEEIGQCDDFLFDDQSWVIRYMVVDTNNWLPGGRNVLIGHDCIESINWADRSITVNVSSQKIIDSPMFDSENIIDREYESRLKQYYDISQD